MQFASWWFCFPGHWKVEPVMVLLGKTELQLLRSLSTEKYLGPHKLLSIKKKNKKTFDSSHEQAKSGQLLVDGSWHVKIIQ